MGICSTNASHDTEVVVKTKKEEKKGGKGKKVEKPKKESKVKNEVKKPKEKKKEKKKEVIEEEEEEIDGASDSSTLSEVDDLEDIVPQSSDHEIKGLVEEEKRDVPQVTITINGDDYKVDENISLYDASTKCLGEHSRIPTLCYHPYLPCSRLYKGKCGICEVEAEDGTLIRSCRTIVKEGLKVVTNSARVEENIRKILREKLVNHVLACPNCPVQGKCSFEKLLQRYEVSIHSLEEEDKRKYLKAQSDLLFKNADDGLIKNESLVYDHSKCLTCYRCVRACEYVQGMSKSSLVVETDVEEEKEVKVFKDLEDYHENMFSTDCIRCGMCSFVCPVGAITENSKLDELDRVIRNKSREGLVIVAQMAPSVRVTFPETYNLEPGSLDEKKIVATLKKLGFDFVFDTNFAADLTIFEEGTELIERLHRGGPFPMFTSCCPAWINLVEQHYPEWLPNLSSCKSPQAMLGRVLKTYWAEKMGIKRDKLIVVSLMPCTAKKSEIEREGIKGDVDFVLTTRELGRLFKRHKVDIVGQKETAKFDNPLGDSSSSAELFGATGGVMEAALRTAYELITKKEFPAIQYYNPVRGLRGIKESQVKINETKLKITVVNGGVNVKKFLRKLKFEEEQKIGGSGSDAHFVEIMMCPGGCVGGGGNPKFEKMEVLRKRMNGVYKYDDLSSGKRKYKKSHENPQVKELYEKFLKSHGSPLAKTHLHTSYTDRKVEEAMADDEL